MRRLLLAVVGILAISLLLFPRNASGRVVELYYSKTCKCCIEYGKYLEARGFEVEYKETPNMESVKTAAKIPEGLQSCHTSKIRDYIIEGHVPVEVIEKVLEEMPDVDVIALPGMPSGSPGMPGPKTGPFIIYSVKGENVKEYMRV
ncbi:MAG: hypothetical protein PWP76_75 [Candidatus Diapherotrites archaeon]|nr:hypothetical protein [Candidatus Diapherotrites archaeon]